MDRPYRVPSTTEAERYLPNLSTMIIKRKGESWSPCQMPRGGHKFFEGTPLTRMEKKEEAVNSMIHSIQSKLNPKAERI
jgi:hypothetical protein